MVDNDLYVRDYAKCVLCYKCVEACGVDHQNTFAIAVAGRGFGARISTELAVPLPGLRVRVLRQLHCRVSHGRAHGQARVRPARGGHVETRRRRRATDTICPYCGVGCTLTLHVQDNEIVKATSPLDNGITMGNLCIKGRFGWRFVQRKAEGGSAEAGSRTQ